MFPLVTRNGVPKFQVLADYMKADPLGLSKKLGDRRSQNGQVVLRSTMNACDRSIGTQDRHFSLSDTQILLGEAAQRRR